MAGHRQVRRPRPARKTRRESGVRAFSGLASGGDAPTGLSRSRSAPTCRVFAYGTLLETARQKKLFGRRVPASAATLAGWSKSRCVGRYYGIVRSRGAATNGGILRVTRAELKLADRWEQAPKLYLRRRLRVRATDTAAMLRCWTYIPAARANQAPRATPTRSSGNGTRGRPIPRRLGARSPMP